MNGWDDDPLELGPWDKLSESVGGLWEKAGEMSEAFGEGEVTIKFFRERVEKLMDELLEED